MSRMQCRTATLAGHGGPVFPAVLAELVEALDARTDQLLVEHIEAAARRAGSFRHTRSHVATSDQYHWYLMVYFGQGEWEVIVAIPHSHDLRRTGGTAQDRSPAVYTLGTLPDGIIERTVRTLADQLRR